MSQREVGQSGNVWQIDAVVGGDKRDFGHKDWDALFESIDCELMAFDEFEDFVSQLE